MGEANENKNVTTNKTRLIFLQERLLLLQNKIVQAGLEDEYLKLVNAIADKSHQISPISDEEFDLMLPKEQERNLLAHYHTMRAELYEMRQLSKQATFTNKMHDWLENPWVKVGLTTLTLSQLAVKLAEIASHSGLFFSEEEDTEYFDI